MAAAGQGGQEPPGSARLAAHDFGDIGGDALMGRARSLVRSPSCISRRAGPSRHYLAPALDIVAVGILNMLTRIHEASEQIPDPPNATMRTGASEFHTLPTSF